MVSQSDISTELAPTVKPANNTSFFKELLNFTSYTLGTWLEIKEPVEKSYQDIVQLVQGDKPELLEQKFQTLSTYEARAIIQYLYDQGAEFLSCVASPAMLQSLQRCGYDFTQRVEDPIFPAKPNTNMAQNEALQFTQSVLFHAPKWRHKEAILFTYLEEPQNLDKIDMVLQMLELGAQTDYHITREQHMLAKTQEAVKEIQKFCAGNLTSLISNPDFYLNHKVLGRLNLKAVIKNVENYFYNHDVLLGELDKSPISNHKILPRLVEQSHKTLFKQILRAHIQHMHQQPLQNQSSKTSFANDNLVSSEKNALFLRTLEILAHKKELPPTFEEAYQFVPPIMHFLNEDAGSLAIFKLLLAQKSTHNSIHKFVAEYKLDLEFNYISPTEYGITGIKPPIGLAPAQTLLTYLATNDKKEHFEALLERYKEDSKVIAQFRKELDPWTPQKAKNTTYKKWALKNSFFSDTLASYEENLMLSKIIQPPVQYLEPYNFPENSPHLPPKQEKKGKFKL